MKFLVSLLLVGVSAAWEVDPRCPEPTWRREMMEEALATANDGLGLAEDPAGPALRGRSLQQSDIFSLKMYWEEGFCWQEEYDVHRRWCWECIEDCQDGEELWWQKCNDRNKNQQFVFLPGPSSKLGRFRTAHHDLCLQLVSSVKYVLKPCSNHPMQLIDGFRDDGTPFELAPLSDFGMLINQQHHPKAGEVVENTIARIARYWKTNLMELVNVGGSGVGDNELSLRNPECRASDKCFMCEGDCDSDDQCQGGLICFQRRGSTSDVDVPGCVGQTKSGRDYCIDKKYLTDGRVQTVPETTSRPDNVFDSIKLNRKARNCSRNDPCDRCEGDCDSDADCKQGLKCFQKDGPGNIPGCQGRESSKTDFCYLP